MLAEYSEVEESKRQKVSGTCTPPRNAQVHLHTRAGRATGSFNDAKYNGESEVDEEEEEEDEEEDDEDEDDGSSDGGGGVSELT